MNGRIFPLITVLCLCLTLVGPVFPASAAAPRPGKNPPVLPEPLAPLTPLVPTKDIVFTVLPRNPPVVKVCTKKDRVFSFDIYEVPRGMPPKQAVSSGKARNLLTPVQVTIQEDGRTIDTVTSDQLGRFQTWSYRPKKTGEHVLTFTAETESIKATQTVNVKAALCAAEVNVNFKESVHARPLPNELTVNITGKIEADDNGNVKPAGLQGSFLVFMDFLSIPHVSQCQVTMPDMSGAFAVSASGTATEDSVDLKLEGGPIVVGPYTLHFSCPRPVGSFSHKVVFSRSPSLGAMQVASLSFPVDGGSQSFSLPDTVLFVGTGMQYADGTASLEPIDEGASGEGPAS